MYVPAQKNTFSIAIIQDSATIPVVNNELFLQKKEFKIQVNLLELDGVYMFASFTDSIYRIADTDIVPGFADLPNMSMAEESFNPQQELLISNEGWAYWFYDEKEDWHRFDKKILIQGKNVTGVKSVKQFDFVEEERVMAVSNIDKPLYLFFVSAKNDNAGNPAKELQRYKLKINWR
jgi:hypothetical protein